MLESRSSYGYYGKCGGVTGERKPKTHKSGWCFSYYYFEVKQPTGVYTYEIKAMDHDHAVKQIKQYVKKNKYELIREIDKKEAV
jgi:hypothetical protein